MFTKQKAKQDSLVVETAQLADQIATFLVPNYNEGQKLAIVDEGVLKYLRAFLPKAAPHEIIMEFIRKMELAHSHNSLEEAVEGAKDFIAFHESINLLKRYFNPGTTVAYKEPFNAEPKPLTLTELYQKRNELEEQAKLLDEQIHNHPDYGKQAVVAPNENH